MAARMRTLAVLAALGVAGLAAAAAARLDVASDDLGAGVDLVASCDTDGIDVSFGGLVYDQLLPAGPAGFAVTEVTVEGIAPACDGQWLAAGLIDGTGEQIAFLLPTQVSGSSVTTVVLRPVPTGACTPGEDFCLGVSAEAVEKIGVVITESSLGA